MQFVRFVALMGPNVWSRRSVVEAWVDLGARAAWRLREAPRLAGRLAGGLPKLRVMPRAEDGSALVGQLAQRLDAEATLAHVLLETTLELQLLAGPGERFGAVHREAEPGLFRVVATCQEPIVSQACFQTACDFILANLEDQPFDLQPRLAHLRDLYYTECLGPSTRAIAAAARARDIPVRRMNRGSLVQLGQGARQRRVCTAETDQTGALPEWISQDKELTKRLLKAVGVPVPEGRPVASPADAWSAANEVGLPVVVKPRNGNHGRGVFMNLSSREEIEAVFPHAAKEGDGVLVERYIPGAEHRVLVVGQRVVAAARGEPAYVVGDGRQTIQQLVTEQLDSDPRRGDDYSCPLSPIEYDATTLYTLERQGFTPLSSPPAGQHVLIQANGNLAIDVTDRVHPEVEARAVEAARVVGLDVAGIDLVIQDIGQPMEPQRAAVVEVNAGPGLHIHLQPAEGTPRPVGEAIVDLLFPQAAGGRIPIVLVAGSRAPTIAPLLADLLGTVHAQVGLACSQGVFVGGRSIDSRPLNALRAAHDVLINPDVEAAVIESCHRGILQEGLPVEDCHVAVISDVPADEGPPLLLGEGRGEGPISSNAERSDHLPGTSTGVILDAVLLEGTIILNIDDPGVAALARDRVKQAVLCSSAADQPLLTRQRALGGRVAFLDGPSIVLADGARERRLPLAQFIASDTASLLLAVAAAWALGVPVEQGPALVRC